VLAWASEAKAQVFVAYREAGIVNEYDADTGALIKERFLSRLDDPCALCVDRGSLYVLQAGVIGEYDAQTGAVLNDHLVSGFRNPGTMAVCDGVLYLASLAWDSQLNVVGPGTGNIIARYDATTGVCLTPSILQTAQMAQSIAVTGQTLFVPDSGDIKPNAPAVFDATTGAPIHRDYQQMLQGADAVTAADGWVWFTTGRQSHFSVLRKYSATSNDSGVRSASIGYFQPLGSNVHSGGAIAVSGEELFIQVDSGTGISKYNATTGDVIKADFILDRGDRLGGLAVIPRATSGQYALADAGFAARNAMLDGWFWAAMNGTAVYGMAGLLLVLAAVGMLLVYFYKPPATATEAEPPTPAEPEPAPVAEPAYYAEIAHLRTPPPVAPKISFGGMALMALFVGIIVVAGGLAWFEFTMCRIETSGPGANHTPDMIGMWGIEPNEGEFHNRLVDYDVDIYPTHLDYFGNTVRTKLEGHWRNNGFWYAKPDGSGEVEVCHLNDPLNLNLHLSAFNSGEQGDVVLYKERGTDDEMKALHDKYPQNVTYPPPAGVIKYGMSQYELENLPWQSNREEVNQDEPEVTRGRIWVYRSDDPHVSELRVTLKNHRVVRIEGGNG